MLTVDILGPQVVTRDGVILDPPPPQQRRVLSLLASRPGETVAREWLSEGLWGGATTQQLRSLQVYVSHLRRRLGAASIALVGNGYRLEIPADAVDEARFRRLAAEGHAALGVSRFAEAIDALDEALALWRGDPFDDLVTREFAARRDGLREARNGVVDALLRARLEMVRDSTDAAMLLPDSTQAHAETPTREGRVMLHLRALAAAGRQADAARVLAEYRRRVRTDLGADASPAFLDTAQAALRREPGTLPQAWGSRIETAHDPVPAASPEHAAALDLLRDGRTRMLTLTGHPVDGARRLGLAIADDHGRRLPGGVLRPTPEEAADEGSLIAALALRLGLSDEADRRTVLRALGSRRTLVLLAEMPGDALRDLVPILLGAGPELTVLVVAEEPVGFASEHVLGVSPAAADLAVA